MIDNVTVPIIAKLKDNTFIMLVSHKEDKWVIMDPLKGVTETIDEESLFERLFGKIIILGKKN